MKRGVMMFTTVLLLISVILNVYLFVVVQKQKKYIFKLRAEVVYITGTISNLLGVECKHISPDDLKSLSSGYIEDGEDMISKDHFYNFGVRYIFKNNKLIGINEYPDINVSPFKNKQ